MLERKRIAAILLAAAFAAPAAAGDVDSHFDRQRSRPGPERGERRPVAEAVRAASRPGAAEVTIRRDEPVTLVVTPRSDAACTVEVRAR